MEKRKYQLKKKKDRENVDLTGHKDVIESVAKSLFKENLIRITVKKDYYFLVLKKNPRKLIFIYMGMILAKSKLKKYLVRYARSSQLFVRADK